VIVICGILGDEMIELMCARLEHMGYDYLFFDERHFPGRYGLCWEAGPCGVSGHFKAPGRKVALEEVTGVYARYVEYKDETKQSGLSPREEKMAEAEYQQSVMELLDLLPCVVVNRPKASTSNDSKVYQGFLAEGFGLLTPKTLVTTCPEEARVFYEECGGRVIYKSLSGIRSIVQRLDEGSLSRLHLLKNCPTQFQEQVEGADIRVHTVGPETFATEVVSEASDYRYARRQGASLSARAIDLPPEVGGSCVGLAAALGLDLAGVDLRRTPDGRYYCFEVNPSPGFLFYERATAQPISEAVARRLRGN
jgi:glutathione synthase/RimK-type ligase-like ATP-grasp enzyme